MNYKEQYQHPKWQKKRLEILERDNFTCTNCGSDEKNLHVHHFLYVKEFKVWEYDEGNLTTFCDECHSEWHETNDAIKILLSVNCDVLNEMFEIISLLRRKSPLEIMQFRKIIEEIDKMKSNG